MSLSGLAEALKAKLEDIGESFWTLETENESISAPKVYVFELPAKGPGSEDFPFILIRLTQGEDGEDGSTQDVELVIGLHGQDPDTYRSLTAIVDMLRANLEGDGGYLLTRAGRREVHEEKIQYELLRPVKWEFVTLDKSTWPFWYASIFLTYQIFSAA